MKSLQTCNWGVTAGCDPGGRAPTAVTADNLCCTPSSTSDSRGGVHLHYSPDHNFTASQVQPLMLGSGGGGGSSTLQSRSQLHCIPSSTLMQVQLLISLGGGGLVYTTVHY